MRRYILLLSLLLFSTNASAQVKCQSLFAEPLESNELWNPFQKWKDGVPSGHQKSNRPLDALDVKLMLNSFLNKSNKQPVESGVVEILDHKGTVIYRTEIVTGQVAQIDLRYQLLEVLNKAALMRESALISYRHTHPPALAGHHTTYNTWKFSEADVRVNESIRKIMDRNPNLAHLTLEASIVYLDPNLTRFATSAEVFQKYLRVKSYRLESP